MHLGTLEITWLETLPRASPGAATVARARVRALSLLLLGLSHVLWHGVLLSSQLGAEMLCFLTQQRSPQAAPCGAEQLSQLVPLADRQGSLPLSCLPQALLLDQGALPARLALLSVFHLIL